MKKKQKLLFQIKSKKYMYIIQICMLCIWKCYFSQKKRSKIENKNKTEKNSHNEFSVLVDIKLLIKLNYIRNEI